MKHYSLLVRYTVIHPENNVQKTRDSYQLLQIKQVPHKISISPVMQHLVDEKLRGSSRVLHSLPKITMVTLYPTFPGVYRDSSQEPRAEGYLCTMQGTG
jgi:hypothetical protein